MKKSIYNNTIAISPIYNLIYNTYTDMYMVVKTNTYKSFLSSSIIDLSEKHPSFYKQLIEAGCIIKDNVDEVALLRDRIRQTDNQTQDYNLTINPTLNCNFKCWYCYEKHLPHSKMEPDVLECIKKHITRIASNLHPKVFHLGFFGGEPLLYYADVVRPILQHLQVTCNEFNIESSISVTSNGYLITDTMVNEMKELKVSTFQITLDGNKDLHNQTRFPYVGADSYTRIVENIKRLIHEGIFVVLRINYTIDNLESTKAIVQDFCTLDEKDKQNIHVDYQRVWQDGDKSKTGISNLLDECIDSFESIGIKVYDQTMNQVWSPCYADKCNQAVINYNGDVYKCTARDFDENNCLGYLNESGEIVWNKTKMETRTGIRFSGEECQRCRIAPLCGGTCAQRILDSKNRNECIRGLNEKAKDSIVLNQFYYNIVKRHGEVSF